MDGIIFSATDAAVNRANGATDPETVAAHSGVLIAAPLTGSILGMSMRYACLGVIAVNASLDPVWSSFALWHELGHVFCGHIDEPAFNFHRDAGIFTHSFESRAIPRQELEANLISAEYNLDTGEILKLIGYDNHIMRDYRRLKQDQAQLSRDYESLRLSFGMASPAGKSKHRITAYRHAMHELEAKRLDLESEILASSCCRTLPEIAGELGTSEIILKYKLEAMRIRGFDIDIQELERYNQIFSHAE